ncbi:F-box/LRR-repeat protein 2 [Medicago truncatula]|nr:F-box/LRR-repeat protein 2 [Medicago truncatula]
MVLPKLRKINLSRHYDISDSLLLHLCKNCEFLEEVVLFKYSSLTCDGIASAIRERPSLRSLSVGRQSNECGWWSNGSHDNISSHFTDSLVSLKGLTNLDLPFLRISDMFLSSIAIEVISLRRLVLRDCINYSYSGIFSLLSMCQCIQHLDLQYAYFLNNQHIFELSSFLGNLVSVNLSYCRMLDESALFSLVSKCPSLNEIKMECTSIGEESLKNSNSLVDFVVSPQLKSLYLAFNSLLCDENIKMFASIFPNLQLLDLRRCKMIRHLNLTYCLGEKMQGVNFKLSKLEVLNLSHTRVDDKALRVISKNCFGLLKLLLEFCKGVTDKGVKHVLKNCTQLREISLRGCYEVKANIVDMMVFARPTLRKIIAPPGYHFPDKKGEVFSLHGCHVC